MAKRFVGREPVFRGKTLYELCCNLKNFGVGRVVYRHGLSRFPETSYYRLTKVEPDMSDLTRQGGLAWGEKVYRGRKFGITRIDAGYKTDWGLVPKAEEDKFCGNTLVLPPKPSPPTHIKCPPLLKIFTKIDMEKNGDIPNEDVFNLKLKPRVVREPL